MIRGRTMRSYSSVRAAFIIVLAVLGCARSANQVDDGVREISADEARAALTAMIEDNPPDADLKRMCGGEKLRERMGEVKKHDDKTVDIGCFRCRLEALTFSAYFDCGGHHDFTYTGNFVRDSGKWKAVIKESAHIYR